MPSVLAEPLTHPERMLVGHPFNPVYLLPLVEVVGGKKTSDDVVAKAMAIYRGIGMHPLRVRAEIDAHIADRLLEAVWREALWLVNDGVATTEEIDDAIRYGFGLRWARWACSRPTGSPGGWAACAISSPSSARPELAVDQVDGHARAHRRVDRHDRRPVRRPVGCRYDVRELERIRDTNLAAILRALEPTDWGAGKTIAALR